MDAVVTDPPYGIGITKSNKAASRGGMGGKGSWDDSIPDINKLPLHLPSIVLGRKLF